LRRRKELAELKLTPEGWVYLVVLGFISVGAVLRNVNLLIFMAGMMYAPLLLNWRLGLQRLKTLRASRRIPNRLHANDTGNIQWICENRMGGVNAWNVVIHDRIERPEESEQNVDRSGEYLIPRNERWFHRLFGEILVRLGRAPANENRSEPKLGFVSIKAGQSQVESYRVFFGQRGKYVLGPATLSTTFPFGLIVCRVYIPKQEVCFVAPQLGQLEPTWEKRIQSIAMGSEAIKRRRALEEDEFYALRPWRSGDSKKNIHWRTTAKVGQPIVKQHDQPNNRDFALILDLFSDNEDELDPRCECALSFATTTLLEIGSAVQGQMAIAVCGHESVICHSRSQQGIIAQAVAQFAVARNSNDPQLIEAVFQVAKLVSSGTPIYIVSSRPRPAIFESIYQNGAESSGSEDSNGWTDQRTALQLKRLIPLIRWMDVESDDFKNLFQMEQGSETKASLKKLSSKWMANARS